MCTVGVLFNHLLSKENQRTAKYMIKMLLGSEENNKNKQIGPSPGPLLQKQILLQGTWMSDKSNLKG